MKTFREKAAFLGGLATAAKRFAPQIGAKVLTRGMGREMANQAKWGAGLGGLVEGGIGAATAEDGHRMEAFGRGAMHGAVSGGVMGGMSGAITAPMKNMRREALMGMGYTPRQAVGAVKQNYGQTLKNVFTGGNSKVPRGAAAFEAVAAPLQTAAEWGIPAAAMATLSGSPEAPAAPQAPQQVRTASDESEATPAPSPLLGKFEPVYISPFTSTAGAGMMDALADKISPIKPTVKPSFLRKRGLPALGAAALTIPTVQAIRALNPEPEPLEDIDVDALKYYFGKQRS